MSKLRWPIMGLAVWALVCTATAAVDASSTTIYACAQKNVGTLRIVSGPEDCRGSEVPVWWNQQGPPGEPGPPGPPGVTPNVDVRRLADLLGRPSLADGLPMDIAHPVECAAMLWFTSPDASVFPVIGLIGTDAVSETFTYHVLLGTPAPGSAGWLGQPGSVTFQRDEGVTVFGGIVTEVGSSGATDGSPFTVVTLEPELARLGRNQDSRVFRDQNAVEIAQHILTSAGVAFEDRTGGGHPTMDCAVQYNESQLDFVRRLAEAEGVFFFFADDGTVAFADGNGGFATTGPDLDYPGATVPLPTGAEAITAIRRGGWLTANRATVRGYDLSQPTVPVEGTASVEDGSREVFDYIASLALQADVDRRASVNLERARVPHDQAFGSSSSADVRSGRRLTIDDATGSGFGGQYIVTGVTHVFVHGEDGCLAYGNVFELTPEAVPYRPERKTAIPTVGGLQTAIVTGPAGVPSYTDELGRVKVQFPWDRDGGSDENSFCWVRVSQPPGVDEAFIPEVGDEVVVGFFEGDPSRPVVVGRLFNGQDLPPAR